MVGERIQISASKCWLLLNIVVWSNMPSIHGKGYKVTRTESTDDPNIQLTKPMTFPLVLYKADEFALSYPVCNAVKKVQLICHWSLTAHNYHPRLQVTCSASLHATISWPCLVSRLDPASFSTGSKRISPDSLLYRSPAPHIFFPPAWVLQSPA